MFQLHQPPLCSSDLLDKPHNRLTPFLHLFFPLLRMFFPQILTWVSLSLSSEFYQIVAYYGTLSWSPHVKFNFCPHTWFLFLFPQLCTHHNTYILYIYNVDCFSPLQCKLSGGRNFLAHERFPNFFVEWLNTYNREGEMKIQRERWPFQEESSWDWKIIGF